jgi:uncharacterized damage-inducible protein DinB
MPTSAGAGSTAPASVTPSYPPAAAYRLTELPTHELIDRYRGGLETFDGRVFELSDEQADGAFSPGEGVGQWSVRTLVGHLADAELAFTHRMRRAVAEYNPVVAPWDENAFIDAGLYAGGQHPLPAFVAVIHTLRRWTAVWLMTLSEEQLERKVMHPERGELTVRKQLAMTTWHLEHHAAFLNGKICKMLGPAPAAEEAQSGGGGCGANCGCGRK